MDIKMPEMNGIETTTIAKQKYPDLKILGISLFGTDDDIKNMENAGASGFLRKGGDIEEIEKAIKIILKGGKY
jgi:DNA-binding NarL/FixJ family response regulator